MTIRITRKAIKQLKSISKVDQVVLARKIRALETESHLKKLSGYNDIYRSRVGQYHTIYRKSKSVLLIIAIGHRKEIYEILDRMI